MSETLWSFTCADKPAFFQIIETYLIMCEFLINVFHVDDEKLYFINSKVQ